jgi:hypothetical protein
MRKGIKAIILYLFIISVTACTSANKDSSVLDNFFRKEVITPVTAGRVYIRPVIDKTGNSGLSDELMTRLKTRINFEGRLVVVHDPAQSDVEMNLEIFLFTIQPLKFDSAGNIIQKKMRTLVSVSVFNTKNRNVILKGKEVEGILNFSEINPPVMDLYSATAAMADILTGRISAVLVTGWYKGGVIPVKPE